MSAHDRNQLAPSIEKLLHYIAVHTKYDLRIEVYDGNGKIFEREYLAPSSIKISPTLYTRIDDCHGAGNCCRVPFDLVYTNFDRQRIENFDYATAVSQFGAESAQTFLSFKRELLDRLHPLRAVITYPGSIHRGAVSWETTLWVQRNTEINKMSGNKSCPYLVMSDDRYLCGVHPFKPLHCWYPHMTVRCTEPSSNNGRPTVSIGRMQYGRNHKFGCPVQFVESSIGSDDGLFDTPSCGVDYFENQFQSDVYKLGWTSRSAGSMGFSDSDNLATSIDVEFTRCSDEIRSALRSGKPYAITLWQNNH